MGLIFMGKKRIMDVGQLQRRNEQRDAENEARKDFENIRKYYPDLKYEDVFQVGPSVVKMKDGRIYRLP